MGGRGLIWGKGRGEVGGGVTTCRSPGTAFAKANRSTLHHSQGENRSEPAPAYLATCINLLLLQIGLFKNGRAKVNKNSADFRLEELARIGLAVLGGFWGSQGFQGCVVRKWL